MQKVIWALGEMKLPFERIDAGGAFGKTKDESYLAINPNSLMPQYLAGNDFSYGDIPAGIMIYRYVQLIPERPQTPNLDRWYASISTRAAFKEQVAVVPLS